MSDRQAYAPMIDLRPEGWVFSCHVDGDNARLSFQVGDLFMADLMVQLASWQRHALGKIHHNTAAHTATPRSPTKGEKS